VLDALDAAALRRWCTAGLESLTRHRGEIDQLNVYPVADADTGTNLVLTMQSVLDALRGAPAAAPGADGLGETARLAAHGALLGARGNSGVILSSLLRGIADVLGSVPAQARGCELAAALTRAADLSYTAVAQPVEGTMLSVARAAAQAAEAAARPAPGLDLAGGQPGNLVAVARAAARGGAEALARTPAQLPVLAREGVVDAAGLGLVLLLEALVSVVTAEPVDSTHQGGGPAIGTSDTTRLNSPPATAPAPTGCGEGDVVAAGLAPAPATSWPQYEVQYLLDAEEAAAPGLLDRLSALGNSAVVAASGTGLLRVHVHVDDVGAAVEAGVDVGRPSRIVVTRLPEVPASPAASSPPAGPRAGGAAADGLRTSGRRAVVATVAGEGLARLLSAEGVGVLDPPVTASQVLVALRETKAGAAGAGAAGAGAAGAGAAGAGEAVVLAGEADESAVREAAALARRDGLVVAVVPIRSPVQALAAVAVADPGRRFDDDVIAMAEAAAGTRFGSVEVALTDAFTSVGPCRAGDLLALLDGDVAAIGSDAALLATELIERMVPGCELLTAVVGAQAPPDLASRIERTVAERDPTVEVVRYDGGRSPALLLLGAE